MKIKVSEINPRVLVAGDPHRVKYIATLLDVLTVITVYDSILFLSPVRLYLPFSC